MTKPLEHVMLRYGYEYNFSHVQIYELLRSVEQSGEAFFAWKL
jgi:hypothetical protein